VTWKTYTGDCLVVLKSLDSESLDVLVTDPPYGLSDNPDMLEVLKHWLKGETYEHGSVGFAGQSWDRFVPGPQIWKEAFRVLKPGAHAVVFAGTRTVDLIGLALRLAGFEVRDSFAWVRGQGMSKSLNVEKATDSPDWKGWGTGLRPLYEPILLVRKPLVGTVSANVLQHGTGALHIDATRLDPTGERLGGGAESADWVGMEDAWRRPWMDDEDARKRITDGVRQRVDEASQKGRWTPNVVFSHTESVPCHHCDGSGEVPGWEHLYCQTCQGTGVLEGCRCMGIKKVAPGNGSGVAHGKNASSGYMEGCKESKGDEKGGYVGGDGKETVTSWECVPGCPVAELDRQSIEGGIHGAGHARVREVSSEYEASSYHAVGKRRMDRLGDKGGASRFYYCPKASPRERFFYCRACDAVFNAKERRGHKEHKAEIVQHPTQKPLKLMRWLVRMVCPPGGTVLDPFMGSGTTGEASVLEGFNFVGVDLDPEYVKIAEYRLRGDHKGGEQTWTRPAVEVSKKPRKKIRAADMFRKRKR
jgi:DNA modification methylase